MPEPDLVLRAQQAGVALESAWQRWRVVHGLTSDQLPSVSSYVGYTIEEPWGQPRVVFGLAAQDAEQLASLLERYDDARVVYTAAGAVPAARDISNGDGAKMAAMSVPQPAQPPAAEYRSRVLSTGHEEPLYKMAAAAVKEATGRLTADAGNQSDDRPGASGAVAEGEAPSAAPDRASDVSGQGDEPVSIGALTRAASAARAAAEARIRAAMTGPTEAREADRPRSAVPSKGPAALPKIHATDVLEALPQPEADGDDAKADGDSKLLAVAADESKVGGDSRPGGQAQEPEKDDESARLADDKPKGAPEGVARRSRIPKGPIPRISKAKRTGAASGPTELPEGSARSGQPETPAQSERPAS